VTRRSRCRPLKLWLLLNRLLVPSVSSSTSAKTAYLVAHLSRPITELSLKQQRRAADRVPGVGARVRQLQTNFVLRLWGGERAWSLSFGRDAPEAGVRAVLTRDSSLDALLAREVQVVYLPGALNGLLEFHFNFVQRIEPWQRAPARARDLRTAAGIEAAAACTACTLQSTPLAHRMRSNSAVDTAPW